MQKKVFVICVDRDNDLGRKAGITGPVIGREKNIEAATRLAIADPTEADANSMFAAVKKLTEVQKEYKNCEVVTLTGYSKTGLKSDKEINRQLDVLQKKYNIEGWVVVTDGMEDKQVIPILQSRAKIISTEEVIIKQAQVVESTFYTIKEALKDPGVARLVFGVPGLLLVIIGGLFTAGFFSLQLISLLFGTYLLLKGFGIEEKILEFVDDLISSITNQRASGFLYLGALFVPLFGIWAGYNQYMSSEFLDIGMDLASSIRITYPFFILAGIMIGAGKAIDSLHYKRAYDIGKYIVWILSIILIWAILDAGTLVFLRQADLGWFLTNLMISFIVLVVIIRIAKVFDVRDRATALLIGTNVIDDEGNILGKVIKVNRGEQTITYKIKKKKIEKPRKNFQLKKGNLILLQNIQ